MRDEAAAQQLDSQSPASQRKDLEKIREDFPLIQTDIISKLAFDILSADLMKSFKRLVHVMRRAKRNL